MAESVFARVWNIVKPPPAVDQRATPRLNDQQKRLLKLTFGVFILGGAGWGAYSYVSSAPQRAEKEYEAGMKALGPGKYSDAIAHLNRSLEISPQSANVYFERGVAHRLANDTDQALADFQQAVALNPNMARAYSGIGSIYRDRKDYTHAMEQYTKSLEIESNADAYFERGQTYESLGQHQKAIDDYNLAVAEINDAPAVYRARALAKRNLGDEAGYIEDRDQARRIEHR
jgi:tetratricopeptide (TPR) repeat protein